MRTDTNNSLFLIKVQNTRNLDAWEACGVVAWSREVKHVQITNPAFFPAPQWAVVIVFEVS
jgi:hypothetical protein